MVSTRAYSMHSGMDPAKKSKNNNDPKPNESAKSKSKFENIIASSNPESDDTEENASGQSESAGTAIKVTLKKTRSCSSTSSRESTQSFKVVKSVPPASVSISEEEEEDDEDEDADNEHEDESLKNSDNEKSDEAAAVENKNGKESDDDSIEILSSDDDDNVINTCLKPKQENLKATPVIVKEENKLSILNTVVDLKTEDPTNQSPTTVENEDYKVNVKSLKEELPKDANLDSNIVLKGNNNNSTNEVSQQNDNEKNGGTKEQKFKVNVRSFTDLLAPVAPDLLVNNLVNNGYSQPNYLTQNGSTPFPSPFINLHCDVCGMQFDSTELLSDHKSALKHYKCTFKECEHLLISSQQEFLDHQRLVHNIMPSPVQQLAHQVQRLPAMGFDQQLQSGISPLTENLQPSSGVPNIYTQPLRMPSQPVPMQRSMRPMMRQSMPQNIMSSRGRGALLRSSRGRSMSLNTNMVRGPMKRPSSTLVRQEVSPNKRIATDRNSFPNNTNKTQIVKSLSESLTKSATKSSAAPSQQDVVNLFSKRGLTISTVDKVKNISLPAGLSLNSAVSIIPTSPQKNLDTVDLTGPDKPRTPKKYYPCEACSKTYLTPEALFEHVSSAHKVVNPQFKCNLCTGSFPNGEALNRHRMTTHRSELNSSNSLVVPIFDLNKPGVTAKLQSMGITNYMPVAQLDNQGGQYGMPIMSVSRPGSLEGLRCSNFFNLGCVRKI